MEKLVGKNVVVFDCEIQNEIDGQKITWARHDLMGLSVACAFDYLTGDFNVYFEKDIQELCSRLNRADLVVGFNTTGFDNQLLRASKGDLKHDGELKNWDILEHSRKATGWTGQGYRPKGMRLDDHLLGTFGPEFLKTEDGADAPKMFQRGELGKLTSYCLADVRREKMLFEHIVQHGWVITKEHGKKYIDLNLINRVLELT
jgi:hypothetical protein